MFLFGLLQLFIRYPRMECMTMNLSKKQKTKYVTCEMWHDHPSVLIFMGEIGRLTLLNNNMKIPFAKHEYVINKKKEKEIRNIITLGYHKYFAIIRPHVVQYERNIL